MLACQLELEALLLDLVEQPYILDRDHRLVGEGRGEIDLSVAESSYHSAHQHDHADRDSFAQQGNAEHGTGAHLSCGSAQHVFRVILNVSYMDDVAFKRSSPSDRAPTRFELDLCHIVTDGGREPMACGMFVDCAAQAMNRRHIGVAQPHCGFNQRVEHRLQIEGRAADHLEHVGGRRLLLQRLAQLVEQARVLYGDDGLLSEVAQELDMFVAEWFDLLAEY